MKQKESFFKDMGITPIIYKDHDDIPDLLGQVYQSGLQYDSMTFGPKSKKQIALPGLLTKKHIPVGKTYYYPVDKIWGLMKACRLETVNASKVKGIEKMVKSNW